jgi:hypothetical protein
MTSTLQTIFGSGSSAGVLTFLAAYRQGYASEIARFLDLELFAVQRQLQKFEGDGLLVSHVAGRTRIYAFNPDHPLHQELVRLIEKSFTLQTNLKKATPLPHSLRAFFWDHHFDRLTWEADRELVIRRLLTDGSWEAITWLRGKLGDAELRKWLIEHQGRGLSPRQLRFWSLVLAIPHHQVSNWIQVGRANPWSRK